MTKYITEKSDDYSIVDNHTGEILDLNFTKKITLDEFIKEMRNGNHPKRINVIDQCGQKWNLQWENICKEYVITDSGYKQAHIVFGTTLADTHVEYYEQILDATEKKYLSNVIRPFKSNVQSIEKKLYGTEAEYLHIVTKDKISAPFKVGSSLPPFKVGSMYTGMEVNSRYSLEELGI
jgi:hypothetical protein